MPSPVSVAPSQPSAALEPVDDTCDRHGMAGPSGSISSTWSAVISISPFSSFACARGSKLRRSGGARCGRYGSDNLRASHVNHMNHRGPAVGAWAMLLTATKTNHRIQNVACAQGKETNASCLRLRCRRTRGGSAAIPHAQDGAAGGLRGGQLRPSGVHEHAGVGRGSGCQSATVVRFPALLGYRSFDEFRSSIQDRVNFDLTGVARLQQSAQVNRSPAALLRRIIDAD